MIAPDGVCGDGIDHRHEHGSEECADVDDDEFFENRPGKCQQKQDADGEEDVATDALARGLLLVGNRFWQGRGQVLLL